MAITSIHRAIISADFRFGRLRLFTLIVLLLASTVSPAAISFVQQNYSVPTTPQSTVTVTYPAAQVAGDTNIVAIGWSDSTSTITSVTDTKNNVYTAAIGPTRQSGVQSQSIYVAKNVAAAAAGANTVTVVFSAAVPWPDVRALAYRGLDTVSPVETAVAATGTGTTTSSGTLTTTNANDLLFGATYVTSSTKTAGTGYTSRVITPDGDMAMDQVVTAAGGYSASYHDESGKLDIATGGLEGSRCAGCSGDPDLHSGAGDVYDGANRASAGYDDGRDHLLHTERNHADDVLDGVQRHDADSGDGDDHDHGDGGGQRAGQQRRGHRDLHHRNHVGAHLVCATELLGADNAAIDRDRDLSGGASGGGHEHRGHRVDRQHVHHHIRYGHQGQRLQPGDRTDASERGAKPVDLCGQECCGGGSGGQYSHSSFQRRRALAGCESAVVSGIGHGVAGRRRGGGNGYGNNRQLGIADHGERQ